MIDNVVTMIIQSKKANNELDEFEKWQERTKHYSQWLDKKLLKEIKVGQKVDVRDTEYIWCVGTVELKINTLNRPPLLYVHYEVR